jgi:hypothetical protein
MLKFDEGQHARLAAQFAREPSHSQASDLADSSIT